jgi:hypothetical protein
MHPAPNDLLDLCEIGPAVNKVANDGAGIQEPVVQPQKPVAKPASAKAQGELF